jgi:hypothetical protein
LEHLNHMGMLNAHALDQLLVVALCPGLALQSVVYLLLQAVYLSCLYASPFFRPF